MYSESLSDYVFIGSGKFCYACPKSIWLQSSFRRLVGIILLFVKVNLVDPLKSELSLGHELPKGSATNFKLFWSSSVSGTGSTQPREPCEIN